jgi:opacity protein-like surface antigen
VVAAGVAQPFTLKEIVVWTNASPMGPVMRVKRLLVTLVLVPLAGQAWAVDAAHPKPRPPLTSTSNIPVAVLGTAPAPRTGRRPPKPRGQISLIGVAPAPLPRPRPPSPPDESPKRAPAIPYLPDWSGPFIEANLGYGWNAQYDTGTIGVQAGTNAQYGRSVLGLSGGIESEAPGFGQFRPEWMATISARVGFVATEHLLPYIALGPVLANFHGINGNSSAIGWTAGVGFAYRLNGNWNATANINYYDFALSPESFAGSPSHWSQVAVRAGLMYHLPIGSLSR